jgi:hypothetical protein
MRSHRGEPADEEGVFKEEQIIDALKQGESVGSVAEIFRRWG